MAWSIAAPAGSLPDMRKRHAPTRRSPAYRRLLAEVGDHLRDLREERALTQEAAAERIGMAGRHLQKIEAGEVNVTLETLFRFARAYRFEVRELFGGPGL
jgi:DNA-binding XRE family transcriptional regulator